MERNKKHQPTVLFSQGQQPSSVEAVLETHKFHNPAFDNFPVSSHCFPASNCCFLVNPLHSLPTSLKVGVPFLSFLFSSTLTSAQVGNPLSLFFLFFSSARFSALLLYLPLSLPPRSSILFVFSLTICYPLHWRSNASSSKLHTEIAPQQTALYCLDFNCYLLVRFAIVLWQFI